jgi:hypothetical protein
MDMKKIVTAAALLTLIGSGAALAQGAPPSFVPWQSGWHGAVAASQAPGTATAERPDSRTVLARSGGSVPVAGNLQSRSRGG